MSPGDPYTVRQPLDLAFLVTDARRVVLRLLLLTLVARRLLVAVVILLLGVWLRFGLSLEPFVVWLGLFTALYVLTCIGEIGSRRLWRDTVTDDDGGGENA